MFQARACVNSQMSGMFWFSVTWQVSVETCLSVSRDRRTSCAVLRAVAQCALVERSFHFVFSFQLKVVSPSLCSGLVV